MHYTPTHETKVIVSRYLPGTTLVVSKTNPHSRNRSLVILGAVADMCVPAKDVHRHMRVNSSNGREQRRPLGRLPPRGHVANEHAVVRGINTPKRTTCPEHP